MSMQEKGNADSFVLQYSTFPTLFLLLSMALRTELQFCHIISKLKTRGTLRAILDQLEQIIEQVGAMEG